MDLFGARDGRGDARFVHAAPGFAAGVRSATLTVPEYGVEPPVVMLGLLRVRPQIRIESEGLVAP